MLVSRLAACFCCCDYDYSIDGVEQKKDLGRLGNSLVRRNRPLPLLLQLRIAVDVDDDVGDVDDD